MERQRKKYFMVTLGKTVPTSKVKQIAELMELTEDETNVLIGRFCEGKTRDQISYAPYFIPIDRQYRMLKSLDAKLKAWYLDHKDFFNMAEIESLDQLIDEPTVA